MKHFADRLERDISAALTAAGISHIHESEGAPLDFYLPDYDVHIEVKRFHTERINGQLTRAENVILLQGISAVRLFIKILKQ